jgi:hypothetical protein
MGFPRKLNAQFDVIYNGRQNNRGLNVQLLFFDVQKAPVHLGLNVSVDKAKLPKLPKIVIHFHDKASLPPSQGGDWDAQGAVGSLELDAAEPAWGCPFVGSSTLPESWLS